MADLDDVLARGYLPKELPPPFTSASYANALSASVPLEYASGGKARKSVTHSLARPGMLVRAVQIPDPVHFYRLAELMTSNWAAIAAKLKSPYSLTAPVDDPMGIRAWRPAEPHTRADARADHASHARFRVTADVSQWYPSVYTHSLDWAVRGKAEAKAKSGARTGLGPLLDAHTRNGQDRQSIGIPIGPDTSLVLGELVLAQVDAELSRAVRSRAHGFRYYDDYELFTSTREAADKAVTQLTSALANWQLALNPYKVVVAELPVPIEEEWVSVMKRLPLRPQTSKEHSDLNALFDEGARLAHRYPREPVLTYAIGRFITRTNELRYRVNKANWPHFEKLMLQAALAEPGVTARMGLLLGWARDIGWSIDRKALEQSLNLSIVDSANRGHGSEVAWAAWLAIQLDLKIRAPATKAIGRLADDAVAIVALHGRATGAIRNLDVSAWAHLMTQESLRGDHWLLAYEACVHGWLPSADGSDYIASDSAFDFLRKNDVRFYEEAVPIPSVRRVTKRIPPDSVAAYLAGALIPEAGEEPPMPLYDR